MKKSILLLSLLAALICQAQPKKTNTIVVSKVSRSQVVNTLLDNGYYIDKIDTNLNTIRTEPKAYTNLWMLTLDIRIKDSSAIITGHVGMTEEDFQKKEASFYYGSIENRGMGNSPAKRAFDTMDRFASLLGGKKEYFTRW